MIVPKQFEGLEDLEAMLLTSILGTFVALKENLISLQQAESYWLSDMTAEIFEEMKLSKQVIAILQAGIKLKDLQEIDSIYLKKIDELIIESKKLIGKYYTDYNDDDEIEITSIVN